VLQSWKKVLSKLPKEKILAKNKGAQITARDLLPVVTGGFLNDEVHVSDAILNGVFP
jgi:hypothetical protein